MKPKSIRISIETRPRATLPLRGTVRKANTLLDQQSDLGVAYAQAWLVRHGSPKVPASGVIRRAVSLYIDRLSDPAIVSTDEVRAVRRACSSSTRDEDARQEAWERLQGADTAASLPPWLDVLHGPQRRSEMAELDAAVDEHMTAIAATPWGRLKGIKA